MAMCRWISTFIFRVKRSKTLKLLNPEDEGIAVPRNVGNHSLIDTIVTSQKNLILLH